MIKILIIFMLFVSAAKADPMPIVTKIIGKAQQNSVVIDVNSPRNNIDNFLNLSIFLVTINFFNIISMIYYNISN